jgi:hypothetical protein
MVKETTFSIQEELHADIDVDASNDSDAVDSEAVASAKATLRIAARPFSCTADYKCPLLAAFDDNSNLGSDSVVIGAKDVIGTPQFDRHIFLARDGPNFEVTSAILERDTITNEIVVYLCTSETNCTDGTSIDAFPVLCQQLMARFKQHVTDTVTVYQFKTTSSPPVPGNRARPDFWAVMFMFSFLFLYDTCFTKTTAGLTVTWPGAFTSDFVVRRFVYDLLIDCNIQNNKRKNDKVGRRFGISRRGNSFASIADCVSAVLRVINNIQSSQSQSTNTHVGTKHTCTLQQLQVGATAQAKSWLTKFDLPIEQEIIDTADDDNGVALSKHMLLLLKQRDYMCGLHDPCITFPVPIQQVSNSLEVMSDSDGAEYVDFQHVKTPHSTPNKGSSVNKRVADTQLASEKSKTARSTMKEPDDRLII